MIEYVDPIPPIIRFLSPRIDSRVEGNRFSDYANRYLPIVLVRAVGGTDFTRLQVICRAKTDIDAMRGVIEVINTMIRECSAIDTLRVIDCQRESNPIAAEDEDSGTPEAWCYLRLEHLEV